jgi:hypothetical protein
MTNDTDLTCPKIAGNSIPPCVCNGDPPASNVDTLALAVTVETYDYNTYKDPYQTINCNNCGTESVSNLYKTKSPACKKNGVVSSYSANTH